MHATGLETLLHDIRGARIAVVGDFCLDAYWEVDKSLSETSIETALATQAVTHQRYSLGGAGNVAANLVAMGVGRVEAFGVLGEDPFGREMVRLLRGVGIGTGGILRQENDWATPVYIKPVEDGREKARIDFGGANHLGSATSSALSEALRRGIPALDIVIINQQLSHGIHTEQMRADLRSLISQRGIPFIVDSRAFSDFFDGAIRKLNDREALRLCGTRWDKDVPVPRELVAQSAKTLFDRWGRPVFITRGPRGILGWESAGSFEVPGLQVTGPVDTVGAGDSALAGIAAALAAGRGPPEAAMLGNFAAAVTVRKLFVTGTASPQEILAVGADPDYLVRPELAEDAQAARYHPGTGIEIVSGLPPSGICAALFDFDGTISTIRAGWERIMEAVMVRDMSSGERSGRLAGLVRDYIDATTGLPANAQVHGMVETVKELNGLDADARAAEYDRELRRMVDARLERLQRGELSPDHFMISGVTRLLELLSRAGVELTLASGTPERDVVREAAVLGIAHFFGGRIHGSREDLTADAKKFALERMAAAAGGLRHVVAFGYGPREIRETRRGGGYAVGVASNERERCGLNPAKRRRLVLAGADLVIADFLQADAILEMLGCRS
jgi:rfaE bifunctional protein kinase chain/domain